MKYKAVLFDFDYTLGDSTDGIVISVNYALRKMGCAEAERDVIKRTIGMSLPETFSYLTGDRSAEKQVRFSELFKTEANLVMTENSSLYPYTIELLSLLREKGCKTGIVTTKYRYRIEQILRKYSSEKLVDIIVGSDDVTAPKPSPEGLLKAAGALDEMNRSDILYIGDNIIDAQTAEAAGVDFAGVLTGTNTEKDFEGYAFVCLAEDLPALFRKKEFIP